VDVSAGAGLTDDEREASQLSLTPHDILRKLPGVNATNIRALLQHVNNLRELSEATLSQLTQWMGGPANAKKLYTFMHGTCSECGMRQHCAAGERVGVSSLRALLLLRVHADETKIA